MAKILSKARSDIDDKFCKFEINKLVEVDETISIISDTWSTDVLASDSETIEPSDCERNFSTPLIPSAVVLPGDNNFDPLSNSQHLPSNSFLDTSETRSESAWSTDVLASDSEKMAELDTDDNQSIAANSDITDAGRSDSELVRDSDVLPTTNRAPDSPFFIQTGPFRSPEILMYTPRSNDSVFSSGRRTFDDSAGGTSSLAAVGPRLPSDEIARFLSPGSSPYSRISGSSGRYSENNLPFRSGSTSNPYPTNYRDTYIVSGHSHNHMKRQNSAESSISNQSSTLDDAVTLNKSKKLIENKSNFSMNEFLRENAHSIERRSVENVVKTSTDIINPFADDELGAQGSSTTELRRNESTQSASYVEERVEHRRISDEQRNASFDGRRNGISFSTVNTGTNSITAASVKRFAKSLNYENHEIIAKTQTSSLQLLSSSATDDDKNKQQDEYLLVQKTISMSLKDSPNMTGQPSPTEGNADIFTAETSQPDSKSTAKYTGAIPKSISFDASADKNGNGRKYENSPNTSPYHQSNVRHNANGNGNGNGFFSKIKKGFRRNAKLQPRATFEDYTALPLPMENAPNGTGTSGSLFLNNSLKSSLENGYNDTEDILEKYRRKISSSSEATNSDSIGHNSNNERKSLLNTDEHRLSDLLLDESIYLYAKTKQKLRLVLSTTDLHTADFRHTNVSIVWI